MQNGFRFCMTYLTQIWNDLDGVIDPENGVVVPVEDDDVKRERDLLHSKQISTLQMDNNLVIK